MTRKRENYIKQWRKMRGLSQKQVVDRLRELAGEDHPNAELKIPTTEASLSRIETGQQNFSIATLEALAQVLEVDEAGWLLDRNPLVEGQVIDLSPYQLDRHQAELARQVLDQMFGHKNSA